MLLLQILMSIRSAVGSLAVHRQLPATSYHLRYHHRPRHIMMHQSNDNDNDSAPTIPSLIQRAQRIRAQLYGDTNSLPSFLSRPSELAYPSTYHMEPDTRFRRGKASQRGYCNWLIPNTIMIGQYPGMTPESNGPSLNESNRHIEHILQSANISLFCCLQTEVPSQLDDAGWSSTSSEGKDQVYLEPMSVRREFPRPFTRYSNIAQALTDEQLVFLHNPIEDLSVPSCNDDILNLLSALLEHLEIDQHNTTATTKNTISIHCWGGRGRAGLIGSCLASLLFPELSSEAILDWVQSGYNTRAGAEAMPEGLKRSPQTEQQRLFVREFIDLVQVERLG